MVEAGLHLGGRLGLASFPHGTISANRPTRIRRCYRQDEQTVGRTR